MRLKKPLLVLPLPGHILGLLFFVWASGFLFVMLRGIFSHLLFRTAGDDRGHVALAYNAETGSQYLFQVGAPSEYEIMSVSIKNSRGLDSFQVSDHDALRDYLSDLKLGRLTGNYSYSNPEHNLSIIFSTPLYSNSPNSASYYCMEPVDWNYLDSLLISSPENM